MRFSLLYCPARAMLAGMIGLGLTGCISVLPKSKPAQLYRFGGDPSVTAPAQSTAPRFTVRNASIGFDHAAATDRILTVRGNQAAYIGGARWISPANTIFEAALTRAFDGHGGPARLVAAGEPAPGDFILRVDVRSFEARYEKGADAAPRIVVGVLAVLTDRKDGRIEARRLFEVASPAGSNSIHAITAAFDEAVRKILIELVAWVDAKGQS